MVPGQQCQPVAVVFEAVDEAYEIVVTGLRVNPLVRVETRDGNPLAVARTPCNRRKVAVCMAEEAADKLTIFKVELIREPVSVIPVDEQTVGLVCKVVRADGIGLRLSCAGQSVILGLVHAPIVCASPDPVKQ